MLEPEDAGVRPEPPAEATNARAVTIYDVALAAGVNASTVSRAFSRPGRVSAKTSQLVHEAAARLGYHAVAVYHPTRSRRSGMLGLLVSDVTNPFYFGIIRGAELAARDTGHSIVLVDSQEDESLERRLLEHALPAIDGLVVASARVTDSDLRGAAKQVPVVVLNRDVSGLACVYPDTRSGVGQALDHLVALGHRRLVYVAGPVTSWADGQRWRAFRDGCGARGLTHHRVGPTVPTVRGGEDAAPAVLAKAATAVVAYNDLVAIGVMRALARAGAVVPDMMSIVGIDNTFASDLVSPALTTIASPLVQLGEHAVRSVVNQAAERHPIRPEPIVVPSRLIVRASTGSAPHHVAPVLGGRS